MATATPITEAKSWLLVHERIVCLSLILLFGGYATEKFYDHEATVKQAAANAATQIAAADAANSKALATQAQQVAAQYAALVQTLSAQNASLQASIAQRRVAQQAQVTTDANLPLSGLAARWNQLIPTVAPTVTPVGIGLTSQEAHDTVAQLEQIPVLVQNLADETKVAANYQVEVQKSDMLAADLNSQILGLQKVNADEVSACKAQVASVKADARKSKISWIKRALAIGFGLGLYAGAHGF